MFIISSGGVVKHYLIAMNIVTHQLTIDGKQYYDTLPALIKVCGCITT